MYIVKTQTWAWRTCKEPVSVRGASVADIQADCKCFLKPCALTKIMKQAIDHASYAQGGRNLSRSHSAVRRVGVSSDAATVVRGHIAESSMANGKPNNTCTTAVA